MMIRPFEYTKRTNEPIFVIEEGKITVSKDSNPEDPEASWGVLKKVLIKLQYLKKDLQINFILDSFNTSSASSITGIMFLLDEMALTAKIEINWYYDPRDEMGTAYYSRIYKSCVKKAVYKIHQRTVGHT